MEVVIVIYYKEDRILLKGNNYYKEMSTDTLYEDSSINALESILLKYAKINIIFDENIEVYIRLYFLNKLENLGCSVKVLEKHICLIQDYFNKLWVADGKEICSIGDKLHFLVLDMTLDNLCIAFLKIENSIEKLCVTMENQYKQQIKIGEYSIKDYLNINKNKEFYKDAQQYVNLEIKDAVEKGYIERLDKLGAALIDKVVLCGEIANYKFIGQFIEENYFLEPEDIIIFCEEDNRIFEGAHISDAIDKELIRMPFIKKDIEYLNRRIMLYQVQKNRLNEEKILLLDKGFILPLKHIEDIAIRSFRKRPIIFKIEIENSNGEIITENIEMGFQFIYSGDEINIRAETMRTENIIFNIIIEHKKSGYVAGHKIILE